MTSGDESESTVPFSSFIVPPTAAGWETIFMENIRFYMPVASPSRQPKAVFRRVAQVPVGFILTTGPDGVADRWESETFLRKMSIFGRVFRIAQ